MRPRFKRKWKRTALKGADLQNNRLNQAKKQRGGGSGGLRKIDSAEDFLTAIRLNRAGGNNQEFRADAKYSNLALLRSASDFFSDFFPAAIALHMQQGCLPSKV